MTLRDRRPLPVILAGCMLSGFVLADPADQNPGLSVDDGDSTETSKVVGNAGTVERKKRDLYIARKKQGPVKLIVGGQSEGGRAKQVRMPIEK